jgi:hypothetical protein
VKACPGGLFLGYFATGYFATGGASAKPDVSAKPEASAKAGGEAHL